MKSKVLAVAIAVQAVARMPGDAEIRRILVDRIDVQRQAVGLVAGVIDAGGSRVVAYKSEPDAVFEIGSATKVFTSLLLADAVARGEVALTDPVAKYLPAEVKMPQRGGRQITLEDLATHTSALPRLPSNLAPADAANPYADYSVAQLYAFLSSYQLPRDIGERYEYSNLGAGLLGHALARRAGMDFESLVRTRITGPLRMTDTSVTLTPALRQRLAKGHNAQGQPAANWDLPTLAGAGALRSTAADLLRLLGAFLGYTDTPLAGAMRAMLDVKRPTPTPALRIALGWHVLSTSSGREIVWHNGGTGGYRSFIAIDAKSRTGVVVLSNMSTPAGIDDIGLHLLDPSLPLLRPPTARTAVTLSAAQLDRCVGKYQLAPTFILTVTREDARLFVQATGQPRFELFAENERDFFLKAIDAQITFDVSGQGRAPSLVLHQGGAHQTARRIE